MLKLHDTLAAARARREEEGEKGFTLIELLVVVIIIGILAAIAIPIFLGQQASARDSAVQSDLRNAKTAVIAFQVDNPGATGATIDPDDAEWQSYGLTQSDNTEFTVTTVSFDENWTLEARNTVDDNTFRITANGGIESVGAD